MSISSPGIGSGLDVNGIVSQLMALERRPLDALERTEASYNAKLSAYGTLKGALAAFQQALTGLTSASTFRAARASVSDADAAAAVASAGAPAGTYSVEVRQLAQSQHLVAVGQASTVTAIGAGTLTFEFGTISGGSFTAYDAATGAGGKYTGAAFSANGAGTKTVTIDPASSSLAGIRDAINAAGIGVAASIVNDGSGAPYRLVLTSTAAGAAGSLKVSVSGDAALAALLEHDPADDAGQNLAQTVAAQDAEATVNGLLVRKASNTWTDVIEGVTLTLTKAAPGTPATVAIERDAEAMTSAVEGFVDAYNTLAGQLAELGKYDPVTKDAGPLQGDSALRGVQTQLRAVFNTALTTAGGGLTTLSDIGVAFASDGRLALDAAKLQRVLDDPTKDVATLFAAVGRPTDSLIAFTRAGTATKSGDYAVSVSQIATRGATAGSVQLGATTLITAGVNDALDIVLDGVAASVTIGAGSYSRAQLAAALQSAINGAAPLVAASAAASVSLTGANELVITSNRYGAASGASVTGGYAQASIFGAAAFAAPGTDVAGSIGGAAAAGSGQALIGSGDAAELELRVNGGATGARGSVKYAQGFAYQLDRLVSGLLAADGPLAARTDGVSSSIRALQSRKDALERRLDLVETRYRAQFAALDAALASMTKTSAFLQQQLASLVQNPGSSDR